MEIETSLNEPIRHKGQIVKVEPKRGLWVSIVRDSGCDGCAVSKYCSGAMSGDGGDVFISVPEVDKYSKGDYVDIVGSERLHRKAVRLITVYPTLAIIAVMTGIYLLFGNQLAAALGAIGTMLVFFLILYLARNSLEREFEFKLADGQ